MKFFEDLVIGERTELGRHVFTAEEIKTFAREFDPQPFHLDAEAAAQSHFGRLCASGWHTGAAWMRTFIDCRAREDAKRTARGEPSAKIGPAPSLHDLKWLKPVYAGDTITYAQEIVKLRSLATRPDWGLMTSFNTGTNQDGDLVISFTSQVFIERR